MGQITFDKYWFGTLTGLFVPLIFFVLVYFVREFDMEFDIFISRLYRFKALPKLISLTLLPDVILFFFFMRKDFLKSAWGVILSLFLYAILILILKFA